MFKASASWEKQCKRLVQTECHKLATVLPAELKYEARWVANSNKSWEWKYFWSENAKLWLRQFKRSKLLTPEWTKVNDELFEDWNRSEHADTFLKALNTGKSVRNASTLALERLSLQLKQIAIRHFEMKGRISKNYKKQFELGEFKSEASTKKINLGNHTVELYSWDNKRLSSHLTRITEALSLIKSYSPESYEMFSRFTKRIVPISQNEFVSYSLQSLPGHSFINLYNRDRLDLMDDLLHENGHHHLNHFLILKNPLREDPDQIYYSPWRRTLRPIRGIYHAHLTFFFALKLYHDLVLAQIENNLIFKKPLNHIEKQKVYIRYLEEWYMLDYTAVDLQRAIERGQINKNGKYFLNLAEQERIKLGELVSVAWKKLTKDNKNKILKLRENLEHNSKLTR